MAIVVTYEAPDHLASSVEALSKSLRPPDRIVVVDNGSSDAPDGVLHVRLGYNSGPAGGFAAGLEQFLASGMDYAWLLDDDVRPAPDCLGIMLNEAETGSVLYPRILDQYGHDLGEKYGWQGLLVPREVVREVGLPRAELFWGSEDGEWVLQRIRARHGYPLRRSVDGRVTVTLRAPGPKPRWKLYYETRNATYVTLYCRPESLTTRIKILGVRLWSLVREAGPTGWSTATRGVFDGVTRRLGIRVTPNEPDRPQVWRS